MKTIKAFAKFLDQPRLVRNFSRTLPPLLIAGSGAVVLNDTYKAPKDKRKEVFIRDGLTMFGAVTSSLYAPKITSKIFRTAPDMVKMKELEAYNSELISNFLVRNNVSAKTEKLLKKIKSRVLSVNEVKKLSDNLQTEMGRELFNNLIPEPENITSKEIFSEIGRLSVFGLIPVLGGIVGGILGDKLTDKEYKERIPNKIKEGAYQYLANILIKFFVFSRLRRKCMKKKEFLLNTAGIRWYHNCRQKLTGKLFLNDTALILPRNLFQFSRGRELLN